MATTQELAALDVNWSLVITTLYPDIGTVVKGNPGSIASLLSVWDDTLYDAPTETELLTALATVQGMVDSQEAIEAVQASAHDDYANLPGWASWTADEAESWIDSNVTDLASAKTALKNLAKAMVYLRNHTLPDLQGS